MALFRKAKNQNYDLWSGCAWYVPGVGGMFTLLGLLLCGTVLGMVAMLSLTPLGTDVMMEYGNLISYPLMFIPALIYARLKSKGNELFEKGYALDSSNFAPVGGIWMALLCILGTVALAFDLDALTAVMPAMPDYLEEALKSMTQGKLWINFLCVSIFAPLFEEWLCRGLVLRGLLNRKRPDGSSMKPAYAIMLSALFFAVIHLNIWQALPAFIIGCFMGYVYYKTGSLKLTMLIHFVNNTIALAAGQSEALKDCETWMDVLPAALYWLLFAAFALLLVLVLRKISTISTARPEGGSDEVSAESLSL